MKNNDGKYDERNRFWTEQALNQFGNTSNFFFLISLGFFAFLFENVDIKELFKIDFDLEIKFSKIFLILAVISAVASLVTSSITVLSRLHDLRLTRHTIWIRKKSYDKYDKEYLDDYIEVDEYGFVDQINNFFETISTREYFIKDNDIEDKATIDSKFSKLRLRNLLLSRFSWYMMNSQFVTLAIAILFYILSNST